MPTTFRWDWGLNKKRCAYFFFPKDDNDLRLVPGDELKLRHRAPSARQPWEMVGHVTRFDQTEEVCLEMNGSVSLMIAGRFNLRKLIAWRFGRSEYTPFAHTFVGSRHGLAFSSIITHGHHVGFHLHPTSTTKRMQDVPDDCTVGYSVDFVWKATSFDRMRSSLDIFQKYSASISGWVQASKQSSTHV